MTRPHPPPRESDRPARTWWVPGAVLLAAFLGPLLVPGQILTEGDLPFFHLPLRHALATLVEAGLAPVWNPMVHGGQPILSNPNYAAFYPPTWLTLASPAYSLQLLLVLHGVLAYAGAWRLVRALGGRPPSAALASAGYAAAPWFLALGDTVNLYCGLAWLPWTLLWGVRALAGGAGRRRAAVLCSVSLALELFAGEPVAALISGLAFLAIAAATQAPRKERLRTVATVGCLALGLSAVQLVPTVWRLADSPRGEGIAGDHAAIWSARPERLADLVAPRLWGDPQRDEEGLWFGWRVHDRGYPYVESLFFGLPLVLLALVGFSWADLPRRGGWAAMIGVGLLLGLGRHGPFYPWIAALPPFSWVRYPEKFLLLAVVGTVFAGALAVDRLGREATARGPRLRIAIGVAAIAFVLAGVGAVHWLRPGVPDAFLARHGRVVPGSSAANAARSFVRREAILVAAAAAAILAALAYGRRRPATLPPALLGITLLQLAYYGQGSNPTLPAGEILDPPPLAADLLARPGRVATDLDLEHRLDLHPRIGPVGFQQVLGRIARLEPYAGNLWNIPYVLHRDYDRMFTSWNEHALALLTRSWPEPRASGAILRAWSVRHFLRIVDPERRARAFRATGNLPPAATVEPVNGAPLVRSVARSGTVPRDRAWQAFESRSFTISNEESCLGGRATPPHRVARADIRSDRLAGGRIELDYEAEGEAFLVVSATYDEGWKATVDRASPTTPCPTVLGQIGLTVPAGPHRIDLVYRTPGLPAGALITLLSLVAAGRLVGRP